MSHPLPFSLPSGSAVLVGGGRSAPAGIVPPAFLRALVGAGHVIHVGCATGADRQVVSWVSSYLPPILAAVRVFAAFAPSGAGSFSGSAASSVRAFAAAGGSVSWLAGGSLSVPLVARLMARSIAALQGCAAAVFFAPGHGSLKVARHALRSGVPVLVSCAGMSSAPVLAVAPVLVSWLGQSFWLFAPVPQPSLL